MPVAIGIAVDAAVRPSDPTALVLSVVGIFAVFITLTASWRAGAWVLAKGSLAEAHRLRSEAVRRILTGTGITTTRTSGELLSITTSDAKAAAEVLELGSRTVAAVLGLILSAFFLLRIDLTLGLGILLVVPLLVLGLNALSPYVQRRTAAQQEAVGLAAGTAADLLRGLRPLRGFGGVPEAARRYRVGQRHLPARRRRRLAGRDHLPRCDHLHLRSVAHRRGGRGRSLRPAGPDQRRGVDHRRRPGRLPRRPGLHPGRLRLRRGGGTGQRPPGGRGAGRARPHRHR